MDLRASQNPRHIYNLNFITIITSICSYIDCWAIYIVPGVRPTD